MKNLANTQRRLFDLTLISSGGGKTTACRTLGARGIPAFDTDDVQPDGVSKSMLEMLRRHEMWDVHNAYWHPLILGGIYATARRNEYIGNPLMLRVFDHTGWFAVNSGIADCIRRVTLVQADGVAARVKRVRERISKSGKSDWRTEKDWTKIMVGQDRARDSAFEALKRFAATHDIDIEFSVIDTPSLWKDPELVSPLSSGETAQLAHWLKDSYYGAVLNAVAEKGLAVKRSNVRKSVRTDFPNL